MNLLDTLPKYVDEQDSYTVTEIQKHAGWGRDRTIKFIQEKVARGEFRETTKKDRRGQYVPSYTTTPKAVAAVQR